jgi:hypothetical protein
VIMHGETQKYYKHTVPAVPKSRRREEKGRLNFTARRFSV